MMQLLGGAASMQSALPILFHAASKGSLLVLLAALAAFGLRKRSAASRHAVWTAAVMGHLAIPALVFILPAWKMPLLPAASWMQRPVASEPGMTGERATAGSGVTVTPQASAPLAPASEAQTAASVQATESGAEPAGRPVSPSKKNASERVTGAAILATIW